MTVDDYCNIIACCAKNGVESINIDKFSIKFHNGISVETLSFDQQPIVLKDSDIPNHQEIEEEEEEDIENTTMHKAEELSLMAIEDPAKFEALLATEDSLLKEFDREMDEL